MINRNEINKKLRTHNWSNYKLFMGCNFVSVLLITAYAFMMRSPTVLNILPEGGDSRKQVMAIFVLTIVGCGVFTAYAASLFFRSKSRETGILIALGVSKKQLRKQLMREVVTMSSLSCFFGALLGMPLSWIIWRIFRWAIIDTSEMVLFFDLKAYMFPLLFYIFILITLFFMEIRFLKRTNVMDIVNEQRKSEKLQKVYPWYGPLGIVLIMVGGFVGYMTPSFCVTILKWYPPAWTNLTYLPLFIGVYLVLTHTVVLGWHGGKNRYKNIITTSIMRFQGRQTIRNMIVITVLLAGAYFASFYVPMLNTGASMSIDARPVDYMYHYPMTENMMTKEQVYELAKEENTTITDWKQVSFAVLGTDAHEQVVAKNGTYHNQYWPLFAENNFLSESSYEELSGNKLDVPQGEILAVIGKDESGKSMIGNDISILTNMNTKEEISVKFGGYYGDDMLSTKFYLMDDADYKMITNGLKEEWMEQLVWFNVKDVSLTYDFAIKLYHAFIDHMDPVYAMEEYYDRITKIVVNEQGREYWQDTAAGDKLSFEESDTFDFKMYWKYKPLFRIMDSRDLLSTTAVFVMLFIFIAIICFLAVFIIVYTRCITIALNNKKVYQDLERLGAGRNYLRNSIKNQISKVFLIPCVLGTTLIYALYTMIIYFNDDMFTLSEIQGLFNCFLLIAGISFILWLFYRFTLKRVCAMLHI